jgi:hypothetical protein
MAEMTCGPKLEEHFWPIRYKIRSGKLTVRGPSIVADYSIGLIAL